MCRMHLCYAALFVALSVSAISFGQERDWIESVDISSIKEDGTASVTLSGVWNDTCVPNQLAYQIRPNNVVQFTATQPGLNTACGDALTEWSLTQDIQPLRGYKYAVDVSLSAVDPENSQNRKQLASPQRVGNIWPRRAQFHGLGTSGRQHLLAYDVVADGSVVVGSVTSMGNEEQAMRWTAANEWKGLGFLAGSDRSYSASRAFGISADGLNIVGSSTGKNSTVENQSREAFGWSQNTGMSRLSDQDLDTVALAVSSDGQVIVGSDNTAPDRTEAFRWTIGNGLQHLGQVFENGSMRGLDVSADGNTIVGQALTPPITDDYGLQSLPFVRKHDGELTKLYLVDPCPACGLAAGIEDGSANAVSANGEFAVGYSRYRYAGPDADPLARIQNAVRWSTDARRFDIMPVLPIDGRSGWSVAMEAIDVSGDGSIAIGMASTYVESEPGSYSEIRKPFVWDKRRRTRALEDVLEKDAGLGELIQGWELGEVTAISDDGFTIVGNGINPDGVPAAWRAHLDHGFVAGDTNFDGSVDFADFLVLSKNFGMSDQYWSTGDFTADGKTTFADFLLLSKNFRSVPVEPTFEAIPEPSSRFLALIGIGFVLLVRRNSRKPSKTLLLCR